MYYIHLKDIKIEGDKQVGTYIGQGHLNVISMLNLLEAYGYDIFISLEPYVYLDENPQIRKEVFKNYWHKLKKQRWN